MPDHDVTVEGRLEMKTFRLVRIVDGEVFMDEQLRIGDKINKKAKPVKEGYYFSGWRNLPDTMPDHDITAVTSMYPARFRVDYELDGEVWRTGYVPYETKFEPEIPEIEGRRFLGWTDAPETVPLHDFVVHGSTAAAEEEAPVAEEPAAPLTYVLTVSVDGETVAQYRSDGLLFSTPTGSTAYSLSAGGPILSPQMKCILMTPVCPHSLFSRSVVFESSAELSVSVKIPQGCSCLLTVDGEVNIDIAEEDRVIIRQSPLHLTLISLKKRNFYTKLNEKLREREIV
jgi:hypothetical protein